MTEQLVKLLKDAAGSKAIVLRYSRREDCEGLWAELEQTSGEVQWSTVVIVYDGQCDQTNIAFRPEHWLTPWDWSVALSVHLYHQPERVPVGGVRCLIVDLSPTEWGTGGRTRFKTVGALVPWIRWYRSQFRLLASNFETLFSDLRELGNLPRLDRPALGATDMRTLVSAWTALFSAPRDRHAIGNIIAPLILAEGFARTRGLDIQLSDDWVTRRFHSMVRSMWPSLPSKEAVSPQALIPNLRLIDDPTLDILHRFRRLRVVLVDDQYALGYHTVLTRLLFGNDLVETTRQEGLESSWANPKNDIRLFSTGRPTLLLDWVRKALSAYPRGPRHFGDDVDILLLDLRLFGDSTIDQASPAEKQFLENVINLCSDAQLQVEGDKQLSSAIEAANSRIANGKEDLRALTLVPVLLSRIDPSLPIILFSSTHQREVVDVFRRFQNVITTFAKPVISGYSTEDMSTQSARDLESAILEALRLHRLRELWHLICQLSRDLQGKKGRKVLVKEPDLTPSEGRSSAYWIDLRLVGILAGEYVHLLLRGRFTDALQLPDNLMEQLGGKFEAPKGLREFDVLVLATSMEPGDTWRDGIERRLSQSWNRVSTWKLIEFSLDREAQAARKAQEPVAPSLKRFSESIPDLTHQEELTFLPFERAAPNAAREIEIRYGSLSDAIYDALERRLKDIPARTPRLVKDLANIASFQFYSLLGAMRNARSHFRCRPLEHDVSIESSACWLWWFFIRSLCLRTAGKAPILPRIGVRATDLETAVGRQWLPTRSFIDETEGEEYCRAVITRFGHLLRLNILTLHPDLADVGEYPLQLAKLAISKPGIN